MASADVSLEETATKIVVSGTNGEMLEVDPPENSENNAQLKQEIPAENELNSKEPNGSPEPATKAKLSAEDYLEKFKINILFEELIFRTLDSAPENPLKFLSTNLETMERENWEPGESKAEKSEAVKRMFKIPVTEPDSPVPGKSNAKTTGRPGTGTTTKGPANPKVGTTQVRPAAVKTTPPRPGATSKTVSAKSTPIRPTPIKPAVKTPATPAKTTVPSTVKTANTGPARTATAGAKTGVTGAAGKTGSSGSVAGAKSVTAVGKTGVKTGSGTSVNRTGATRPISAPVPAKTGAKLPATKAPPPKPGAPRTVSSGARVATKTAVKGPAPKTGPAQPKSKAPGPVPRTPSSGSTEKAEKSEPVQKSPSPIEEAKAPTPEEPVEPVDDGVCSKIPGSEEVSTQALDPEELIALEDVQNNSDDDEDINVVNKSTSVDNQSNESPLELEEVSIIVDQANRYVTSPDIANELQAIEDDVNQNRQSDDEGIEVNHQEMSNYPSGRLRTAEELDNPGLFNLSLDPKGFSELTQANITVEVIDGTEAKQEIAPVERQDEIPGETNATQDLITDFNGEESIKEKPQKVESPLEPLPPIEILISEETTQTETRESKYSEDLGIDVEEQNSPKGSPVLDQAIEPIHSTTDQLITDTPEDTQLQVEPDSTTGELRGMQPSSPSPDLVESSHSSDVTKDIPLVDTNLDDPEELMAPLQKGNDLLIDPIETGNDLLIAPTETGDDLLIAPIETGDELLTDPIEKGNDLSTDPLEKGNDLSTDPLEKGNDLSTDPMPQKSLIGNEQPNLMHSPDSDEQPQPQLYVEPIFPASTGDD